MSSQSSVSATLTVDERHRALQLAQENSSRLLGPWRWLPLALVVAVVAIMVIAHNFKDRFAPSAPGWLWLVALLAAYLGAIAIALRLRRRLAADLPFSLQLTAEGEFLALQTENAFMRWPWAAVTGCETAGDTLVISVRGLMIIAVPLRAFGSAQASQQFVAEVRSHLPSASHETRIGTWEPSDASNRPLRVLISDFAHNFYAGTLLLVLRRNGFEHLRVSSAQFALIVAVDAVSSVLLAWLESGGRGFFNWSALPNSLFFILSILAAAAVAAWLAGRSERILALALAIAAIGLPASLVLQISYLAVEPAISGWLWWAFIGWTSFASAVAAVRMLAASATKAAYIVPSVLATLVLPLFALNHSFQLWTPLEDRNGASADYRAQYERAGSEAVLYAQARLLDEALGVVQPGKAGTVELFYVGFAGTGYQDVFLNEVTGAEQVLKERFALGPHSVILANSMRSPEERPFATATALRRTLDVVAQKMNRDEDVLLLFLTAHGASNHELEVQMFPFTFKQLSAKELREMLDSAGIKNRVLVVSACYAGGFIPPNQDPHTLIIAAAHAEKTSFGCRDGAQWTYFGQAFFSEALSQTNSFEDAFRVAAQRIREREGAERLEPSDPQMFVGERIGEPLQALYRTVRRPL